MTQLIVTYNAPGREFIGYRDDNLSHQVTVSDADVDARAADEQRAAFEHAEDHRAKQQGGGFVAREFTPTPETNQHRREQLAYELCLEQLPEAEEAPAPKKGKREKDPE